MISNHETKAEQGIAIYECQLRRVQIGCKKHNVNAIPIFGVFQEESESDTKLIENQIFGTCCGAFISGK